MISKRYVVDLQHNSIDSSILYIDFLQKNSTLTSLNQSRASINSLLSFLFIAHLLETNHQHHNARISDAKLCFDR